MSSVLFVHDHRFARVGESVHTESQFEAETWLRYLAVFDSVVVVAREECSSSRERWATWPVSSRAGVSFELLPSLSSIKAQLFKRSEVLSRLRKLARESRAIVARLPSELGLVAVEVARELRKPYAVEVVGCAWDALWNHGAPGARAYAPILTYRVRRAVRNAPFVLYVTEEFLQRRYPAKTLWQVACSNVDIDEVSPEVLAARLKRVRNPTGPVVLGLIGSLKTRYKGIQTVLQALSIARDRLGPVAFRVLGSGDAAAWRKLADRLHVGGLVSFDGALPSGSAVFEWLDGIDIYLQPSLQEGLPRALIEAMSRGCPAIGSTCGGIPELLPREDLIKPGDAVGLARVLCERLRDQRWATARAVANWKRAQCYTRTSLNTRRRHFFGMLSAAAS